MNQFEIVTTTAGAVSIRNCIVNEIMHNPVGPWVEANSLYIDQSKLRERLLQQTDEFVVFDVGLGAAANALATLACHRALGSRAAPLRLVSYERDLDLIRFALQNAHHFDHFEGYVEAIEILLRDHVWKSGQIVWELRAGDFLKLIDQEWQRPHLIFFDPYSPKVNQDMWTTSCFSKLRRLSRGKDEGRTHLYTYSQATGIRVAMIQAGFFVGYGASTGIKAETTEASTDYQSLASPLGEKWRDRWSHSHLRYPFDSSPSQYGQVDAQVDAYFQSIQWFAEQF